MSFTEGVGGQMRFADCSSSEPAANGVRERGEVFKVETSDVLRFAGVLNVEAGVALAASTAGPLWSCVRGAIAGAFGLSGKKAVVM
jgi:hypothetical protein